MDFLGQGYKDDIHWALDIWVDILEQYSDVEYVYAHGSAVKTWETDIDYVPFVSDVDLHILPVGEEIFDDKDTWKIPLTYEQRFREEDHTHLPRVNIKNIRSLMQFEGMVFAKPEHVKRLNGTMPEYLPVDIEEEDLREIDRKNLLELRDYYPKIPEMVIDRTGIEFWLVLRQMTWRVSPTPVRLLTQIRDNPSQLWEYNRTKVASILYDEGFDKIAESYQSFYLDGWRLFKSGFRDSSLYVSMIQSAYNVIKLSVQALEDQLT